MSRPHSKFEKLLIAYFLIGGIVVCAAAAYLLFFAAPIAWLVRILS